MVVHAGATTRSRAVVVDDVSFSNFFSEPNLVITSLTDTNRSLPPRNSGELVLLLPHVTVALAFAHPHSLCALLAAQPQSGLVNAVPCSVESKEHGTLLLALPAKHVQQTSSSYSHRSHLHLRPLCFADFGRAAGAGAGVALRLLEHSRRPNTVP